MKNKNDKIEKISELISADYILGLSLVRSVSGYDGELSFLDYMEMDEFNSYTDFMDHHDLVGRVFYGKGFNPNDAFFRFDAYENLESCSEWKLKREIIKYREDIAEAVLNLWGERYFDICEETVIKILEDEK